MQFLYNEDSNLYGYAGGEDKFVFPSHVKQMGGLDTGLRIYVEDYVYTYLYQYAKAGNGQERLAALAGRYIEEENILIISGAIQGRASERENGMESFSEETWQYINSQMEVYFQGLSLVGWAHIQPGFGAALLDADEIFHAEHFAQPHQVLLVLDPMEKQETFFIQGAENNALRPTKGFFIYYDKNKSMQEYMLDNTMSPPKMLEEEEVTEPVFAEKNPQPVLEEPAKTKKQRIDAAKDIRRLLKKRATEAELENRRRFTVLAGVSSVLCLATLVMGISLMGHVDRVKRLESEMASVQSTYTSMSELLQRKEAQMVFAAQTGVQTQAAAEGPEAKTAAEAQTDTPESTEPKEEDKPVAEVPADAEAPVDKPAETSEPVEKEAKHLVEEGDTLGYISQKYYGNGDKIADIMQANGINDANKIIIGQTLIIP